MQNNRILVLDGMWSDSFLRFEVNDKEVFINFKARISSWRLSVVDNLKMDVVLRHCVTDA